MNQTDRPTQIAAILKTIASEYPAGMGASLEAYISNLEAKQQAMPPSKDASIRGPVSLHWQAAKRKQQRRERALRKHRNYR